MNCVNVLFYNRFFIHNVYGVYQVDLILHISNSTQGHCVGPLNDELSALRAVSCELYVEQCVVCCVLSSEL